MVQKSHVLGKIIVSGEGYPFDLPFDRSVQDPLKPFSINGCGTLGVLFSVLIMDSGPGKNGGYGRFFI